VPAEAAITRPFIAAAPFAERRILRAAGLSIAPAPAAYGSALYFERRALTAATFPNSAARAAAESAYLRRLAAAHIAAARYAAESAQP
jgi:hypothetical protein